MANQDRTSQQAPKLPRQEDGADGPRLPRLGWSSSHGKLWAPRRFSVLIPCNQISGVWGYMTEGKNNLFYEAMWFLKSSHWFKYDFTTAHNGAPLLPKCLAFPLISDPGNEHDTLTHFFPTLLDLYCLVLLHFLIFFSPSSFKYF